MKFTSYYLSFCKTEFIIFIAAKFFAVFIVFAIPIRLMSLIKQIAMYVESSNEVFIRNAVYFGFSNLF